TYLRAPKNPVVPGKVVADRCLQRILVKADFLHSYCHSLGIIGRAGATPHPGKDSVRFRRLPAKCRSNSPKSIELLTNLEPFRRHLGKDPCGRDSPISRDIRLTVLQEPDEQI